MMVIHYKVYTPFYKELIRIRKYQPNLKKAFNKLVKLASSDTLDSLKLLEAKHHQRRQVGERAVAQLLEQFLTTKIKDYKTACDYMSTDATSTLSPYLHFGEISSNQIFNAVQNLEHIGKNEEYFIKELVWHDFSYYQIYYYPELHDKNINQKW